MDLQLCLLATKCNSFDNLFPVPDLSSSAGSRVVVVTANAWSGAQSYLSVVQTNVDMYRGIIPSLARLSPKAVIVIASQPGQYFWKRHPFECILIILPTMFFVCSGHHDPCRLEAEWPSTDASDWCRVQPGLGETYSCFRY